MSKVDTAWLRMDSAGNLMMIAGAWTLRPGITHASLCERVREHLLTYDCFRQRVEEDATGVRWEEDYRFDIDHHVQRDTLAPHATADRAMTPTEALQSRVADLATKPLDRRRPLWQMHLVEDFDGGSALIVCIHQCIADGIALICVLLTMVDGGAEPTVLSARRRRRVAAAQAEAASGAHKPGLASAEDWVANTVIKPLTEIAVRALDTLGDGAARSMGLLRQPQQGVAGAMDLARTAYQVLGDAASLALMPDDSPARLKGQPMGQKRVAWCQPLTLDEVKAVGRALNGSVNNVMLACVASAIGEYLRSQGDDPAGQEIRAMIPVKLRPVEEAWRLGNRFGLVPLVLPIGMSNPVERVYEVRRRVQALRGSTQPSLAFVLLTVAGLLIKRAQDVLLNLFGRKTTAVMTNVPGPREKLRFLGASLEQVMFWVPPSGDIGLGVTILSYGGGVQFGVFTDRALCDEPQRIIDAFEPELAKLSRLTLILPWEGEAQ